MNERDRISSAIESVEGALSDSEWRTIGLIAQNSGINEDVAIPILARLSRQGAADRILAEVDGRVVVWYRRSN